MLAIKIIVPIKKLNKMMPRIDAIRHATAPGLAKLSVHPF